MMMRYHTDPSRAEAPSHDCFDPVPCLANHCGPDERPCELCRQAARSARSVQFAKGRRFTAQCEPLTQARSARYLMKGAIGACLVTPDGRRQITELFLPGDMVIPFNDPLPESWLEVLTDIEAFEISLPRAPENATSTLYKQLDTMLLMAVERHALRLRRHAVLLGRLTGPERINAFLIDLVERIGRLTEHGWKIRLPLGREHIADYLGLNPETVSRLLRRAVRDGLIRFNGPKNLEVLDLAELRESVPF